MGPAGHDWLAVQGKKVGPNEVKPFCQLPPLASASQCRIQVTLSFSLGFSSPLVALEPRRRLTRSPGLSQTTFWILSFASLPGRHRALAFATAYIQDSTKARFPAAMTEVSATRLYLGNLPRNGP